jgi:hypothetical protein
LQRALADAQSRIELLQRDLEDVRRLLALKGEQLGSVHQPERSSPELPGRMGEDAAAAERSSEGRNKDGTLRELVREHAAWLLVIFVVGFALWVVMPVKTGRVWLRRRHRPQRATIETTLELPRTRRLTATHLRDPR